MRMIGAEYWELPQIGSYGDSTPSIVHVIKPTYQKHLRFYWVVSGLQRPSVVNLTEARQKYGSNLEGFYDANRYDELDEIIEKIGSIWCGKYLQECEEMWCQKYLEHCHERDRIRNFGIALSEWRMYQWRTGFDFSEVNR